MKGTVRPVLRPITDRWPYFIAALVNAVVVSQWFEPGRYIGAGDVSPLIRNSLRAEAFSTWGHQLTGAGGTRTNTGRSIETLLIRIVEFAGGNTLTSQRVLYAMVAAVCGIGAVHAARLILKNQWAMCVAGILAFVNPYVMLYIPNVIFPLALGTIGLLVGELAGSVLGYKSSVFRLAACTVPVAYLSINPPLVVVTVAATILAVTAAAWGRRGNLRTPLTFFAKAGLPLSIFHLWWIIPTAVAYASGGPVGVDFTADTSDTGWAWVTAQNDLDRIATLTAHWGWEQYKPYSSTLDSSPWVFLRWVLPLGALGGIATLTFSRDRRRRLLGAGFGISVAGLLVISQGLHGTFEEFNLALYQNVPGWWLFRDPASKFGPVLALLYVIGFGLLIETLWEKRPKPNRRYLAPLRPGLAALGAIAAALSFLHPYPLLTGEVIPARDRGVLPPSRVEVPREWEEIDAVLSGTASQGKIAVFPINDYYQVTTSWGYHGVDLANQFFGRPVLQSYPGGYFEDKPEFDNQYVALFEAIRDGNPDAVHSLSRTLGTSHLIIRKDTEYEAEALAAEAKNLDGLTQIYSSPIADVYEVNDRQRFEHVQVATEWAAVLPASAAQAIGSTGNHAAPSNDGDSPHRSGYFWKPQSTTDSATAALDTDQAIADVSYSYSSIEETPDSWQFVIRPSLAINGDRLEDRVAAEIPKETGTQKHVVVAGQAQPLVHGEGLELEGGDATILTSRNPTPLPLERELDDCNNIDQRPLAEVGLRSTLSDTSIELSATEHTACAIFEVPASGKRTIVSYSVDQVSDGTGRACLWNHDLSVCEIDQKFTSSTSNKAVTLLLEPSTSRRSLYFHAVNHHESTTTATYGLPIASTVDVEVETISITATSSHQVDAPDGVVELESDGEMPNELGPFGELRDCHKYTNKSLDEAGLTVDYHDSGVTLAAEDHSACVSAPISSSPGATLDLSFDVDILAGSTSKPRFCVWQDAANACIVGGPLRPDDYPDGRYSNDVKLEDSSGEALLFFYADGKQADAKISYKGVAITRDTNPEIYIRPAESPDETPNYSSEKLSSDRYSTTVELSNQTVLITLPESFDPQWDIELPDGWSAEHFAVDGYANGWFVTGDGEGELAMTYRPSVIAGWAQKASLVIAVLLVLNLVTTKLLVLYGRMSTRRKQVHHG